MARRTPTEARPLDLDDATPYTANLTGVQYQQTGEAHPDWPDQFKFVWSVDVPNGEPQELWTWASIKLGQTKGGKVAKLRSILNALAGRKATDPIAWLEDGSDGEPIAWGYPDGSQHICDSGEQLRLKIVGHNDEGNDGGNRFVVDQYASARSVRTLNVDPALAPLTPRPAAEPVTAAAVPF